MLQNVIFRVKLLPFTCQSFSLMVITKKGKDSKFRLRMRCLCGRRGGLMVSALYSGSNDPGSSLGRGTALCSYARHFTLTVPLFT